MIKNKFDLLKIGVFLLGISGIIIAFVVFDMYSTFRGEQEKYKNSFYAHCSEKAIIINANGDLHNVEVLNNQSHVVCSFDGIPANSEELCVVETEGFYIVKAENKKDVVECKKQIKRTIIPTPIAID